MREKDIGVEDEEEFKHVANLGKRVAEMTRIVKAGISVVRVDLPREYFYSLEELQ